ncbi:SusD/RagB family nutrient-binding outer membrane lipoprotein [Chitinophaga lutea]|uniref:SusD/RagB family nutrient-binding outer membrane lipoprotein n=1 Tax=Chitinophaga lutea TaxID=2488634 RepID=A0A3N4PB85_9BACT|nr:SusD/RagB family nutrient-binding outer membrane lipoprotein [Chitinophaga lutea]RPE05932.1 SusD/RagB family nutrient-binding outer membrane lipoprotein [Chitinophaga lutea]
MKKHIQSLLIWLLLCLAVTGCTKRFDKLNTPENLLPEDDISPALIGQAFAFSQYHGLCAVYVEVGQTLHADMYAQYFTSVPASFSTDQFVPNGSWVDLFWKDFYTKAAPQLFLTEKVTAENNLPVANAIAKIWRVVLYGRMTDYFGPVIYSHFGEQSNSVAFDRQEDIYADFFKTLDEAAAVLKQHPTANGFGTHDQVYAGSAARWLKLANSMRLRLALRIAYANPSTARTQAEKAVADGVITTNDDNAHVLSTTNSVNILSRITYLIDFRASATMISALTGYNDRRMQEYFSPSVTGGKFTGLRNGLPASERGSQLANVTSFVGAKWLSPDRKGTLTPNRVLSAAEVAFLRAEGALRGWNMGGTAKDLYNQGIALSLSERVAATGTEITDYQNRTTTPAALADKWNSPAMSDIPVKYDDAGSFERRLEQIITQKWIALYPDGWEAWAERRRTGYPRGYAIIATESPNIPRTGLVRRVTYPPVEISTNRAAYDAAVGMLGGPDENFTRLWWDKKPLAEYPVPTN